MKKNYCLKSVILVLLFFKVQLIGQDNMLQQKVADSINSKSNIDIFFDKLFQVYTAHDPQILTEIGLLESKGVKEHNAHLTDISPKALMQDLERKKAYLKELNSYSIDTLTDAQKISYQVFFWKLNHEVRGEKFLFHKYQIHQLGGILRDLNATLTQFHILENLEDIENYINRLTKIEIQINQAIELLEFQRSKGIVVPNFTLEKVTRVIAKFMPDNLEENVFYDYLAKNLASINIDGKEAVLAQVKSILKNSVYPAYESLKKYFENLSLNYKYNHGVWALPNGDEYYSYMLKHHTTTNLSAQEIYNIGLQEVDSIQKAMRSIFVSLGIDSQKSIGVLMQELAKNSEFYYPNTQAGRQQCMSGYQSILDRSRKELAHLFDLKPKAILKIQAVPEHEQEGMPGAYYFSPSLDGKRAGIFFVNLRNMTELPKYGMETLTIHEAEPGHHFQLAIQAETDMPLLRKIGSYNAHAEGWALYTEKLAYENNFYSSPYAQLGHFQDELLRAVRLVLDTGIHYKRWSREQAIEYMQKNTGYHYDSVVTEVERYFVLPGQACSYKIGQLKILELRQKAKDALGEKFDIKEFHNIILKIAAVPLTVLEENIDNYITKKRDCCAI